MLLIGAGTGEATCGILYLASYLRRNGIEAFVRIHDADESAQDITTSLSSLLTHVRPRLVGISLKWFHHLARARLIARTLRRIDPEVRIVLGGNTASWFWRELAIWDCVDHVVLGDGEAPLLALCRQAPAPPNCVSRAADGTVTRAPLGYIQDASSREVFYSHFDEVFLSKLDQHSFSGWVAPGKGCDENCVYCGGARGVQQASFGRAKPFLRSAASVRLDHRAIAPFVWQLRYDFSGGTADFLASAWEGLDLSGHSSTYFLWGVPPRALIETLARTFQRVFLVLDIGCFSELQRGELIGRGLLKPCPSDRELLEAVEACRRHDNLELEVCGIAGLPFTSARALAQERRLMDRLFELGCAVGYQRLEAQPGALVTEHPERFGMVSDARSFGEFLSWFSRADAAGAFPMVRFGDPAVERAVQRNSEELHEVMQTQAATKGLAVRGDTRLVASVASTLQLELGDWFGRHRVPERVAREPVTVLRSTDGTGLTCAPSLSPRHFSDPALEHGASARAILAALAVFARPTTVSEAVGRLGAEEQLDADMAGELVGHLAEGHFLRRA